MGQEECPICLDEYVEDEDLKITKCGHIYHDYCLIPCLKKSGFCPYCEMVLVPMPTPSV